MKQSTLFSGHSAENSSTENRKIFNQCRSRFRYNLKIYKSRTACKLLNRIFAETVYRFRDDLIKMIALENIDPYDALISHPNLGTFKVLPQGYSVAALKITQTCNVAKYAALALVSSG